MWQSPLAAVVHHAKWQRRLAAASPFRRAVALALLPVPTWRPGLASDKAGNRTALAYPGASRALNYTYDALNGVSLIKNGSNVVAEYRYVGPQRVSDRKYVKASDGSTEVTTLHVPQRAHGGE